MLTVAEMRRILGMNQAEYAEFTGFSQQTVSRWERIGCPAPLLRLLNLLFFDSYGEQLTFEDLDHSSPVTT